jgi:N-acetylmuramoyl-L-alanine amidase
MGDTAEGRAMVGRARAGFLVLIAVLVAGLPGVVMAARPEGFELKGRAGSLGRLQRIVLDDGAGYVSAPRLASLLGGTWSAKDARGTLSVGKRTVQFVRNQSRIMLAGQPMTLDSPARVGATGWLIPEEFLARALPRLVPGITAVAPAAAPRNPPAKTAKAASIALEEMRYRSYPSFTRVVVETGGALAYVVVSGREEIRVRLPRLLLGRARTEEIADGLVKEIRLEPSGGDAVLRVTLEGQAGEVRTASLQDPFRLVLDIYRQREAAGNERGTPAIEPLRLIVLDAGHGGHDPGATGPSGVMEKDVVLDVTRRAARLVEEGLAVKVALSRSTDVFVPLRDRTAFASKQRADLFVSIHANAHPRAVSEGVEVYFLSSEASDSDARQVAAIENGVIQLESPGSRQKSDVLKSILWDLAQSEFQHESSFMAETVLDSMTRSLQLVPRGVKQAGFYVLGGATMPAILIEIGFLTNKKEERKLATPEYREAVAQAIYAGLSEYKRRHDQRVRTARTLPVRAERAR